jgi:TonB-dependent receptor
MQTMTTTPRLVCSARLQSLFTLAVLLAAHPGAELRADGSVEGRVLNTTNGRYINNARITVEGTALEAFSDEQGYYRLAVPAGPRTVRVFYTGLRSQVRPLLVTDGQRAVSDFNLGTGDGDKGPVALDPFVVESTRDMNAAALAINEQRFATNIKSVISTDSFGEIAEGNVGDFAKFLPGVTIDYGGGGARGISVGGMPTSSTPVMIDGNLLASAASSSPTREIELEQVSINNMSRVEVSRSPNADSPASAIGGWVNLVSKNAFERAKPSYSLKTYLSFRENDIDHFSVKKSAGPYRNSSYKLGGNIDFSAIVPVNKRFGFTVSGLSTRTPNRLYAARPGWVPNVVASSAALPAPGPDRPYLGSYNLSVGTNLTYRSSIGVTVDFRLSNYDTISTGFQYSYHQGHSAGNSIMFEPVRTASFGPTFTQGAAGAGRVQTSTSDRDKSGTTWMPSLRYVHSGPVWRWEANAAYSNASNHYRDISEGYWSETNAFIRNVTVRFDNPGLVRPQGITVMNAAGQPIDPYDLGNSLFETGRTNPEDSQDTVRTLRLSARRSFDWRIPLTIKTGLDLQSQHRDINGASTGFTYFGPDGRAATADNNAAQWLAEEMSRTPAGFGFAPRQIMSTYEIGDTFKAHPEYFQLTEAQEVGFYRNAVNGSKEITEMIYAPYVRFDTKLLRDRLIIATGVRFERTEDDGSGALTDPAANYQRDANGNILRNAAGQPLLIAPATSLQAVQLISKRRAAYTKKSYDGFFPSFNAAFNFTDKLLGRLSYARSIARPDFGNILPALSLPDPATTARTITLTNPNLKPWTADSYGLSLEYYFDEPSSGVVSARAYRRDISDFWGVVQTPPTEELLDAYGIDPVTYSAAAGYLISTRLNGGAAKITGLEFDYRQSLGSLVPWAKGLSAFGNITMQHLQGSQIADFIGYVQKTINLGFSYNQARFTGRVAVNLRGRERGAAFVGAGAEPGTYQYKNPRDYVDVSAEYRFTRKIALFASARDLLGIYNDFERYGPSTPRHARLLLRQDIGTLVNIGLKTQF